jgi:hypothetical protein
MSRYRLVDAKTGLVIRHSIRTLREAERERGWYEENTGREIRVIKVFFPEKKGRDSGAGQEPSKTSLWPDFSGLLE